MSPVRLFWPVHALSRPPVSATIPVIWPGTSPVNVRPSVHVPCAMTGDGDATVVTGFEPQAVSTTMRATMPATRSMWSNGTRDGRLGTTHPGHAVPRGGIFDRPRGRDGDLARAARRLLFRDERPQRSTLEPDRPRPGGAPREARGAHRARRRVLEPIPASDRDREGDRPRRTGRRPAR